MFGYEDRRTQKERDRDLELSERRQREAVLAQAFLEVIKTRLDGEQNLKVGLVSRGSGWTQDPSLLVESDGVVYSLSAKVDHD
jgi:hypothetical protein